MTVLMILAGIIVAAVLLQIKDPRPDTRKLSDMFPVWKVEKDCILSKSGDMTLAFELSLPEIFTLSNDDYEVLHQAWLKAIKVLPAGTILHKQDYFQKQTFQSAFKGEENFMQQSSDRFFNERPFLDHSCYLMLTFSPPQRRPATSAVSSLLRKRIVPSEVLNARTMQGLLDAAGQFQRILSDSDLVSLNQLKEDELIGSEESPGLFQRYLFLLGSNDTPELRDIGFKPEWKIGENYCQMYSVADAEGLPSACGPRINYDKYSTDKTKFPVGFATPVGQLLPVNHVYNQYLLIGDPVKTFKRLESKRQRMFSLSTYSRENALSSEAVSAYLNEAISESRMPVKAHFNLLCWTDNREDLKDLRNHASSALSQMEVMPRLETTGAAQLWWAGIPGNEAELPENETFETFAQQASCFLNMETAYRSSKSPFGIRLGDRLTGVPIHIDISDEPMGKVIQNRNKIVVGGSGSGKSMFMNHLVHSYLLQGAHAVIVDVGHSYEGLCKLVDGYYFTYSEENPIRFNPFYIGPGDTLDTEKKESIKTLLVALWKQNDETFRRSEYVAISNALQSYFKFLEKNEQVFPCFDTFYEFIQEHFTGELQRDGVKDRDFDIHNFLYVLRPFYKGGEFDYLLNARENLDVLHQPLVIFELDAVKDHPILFPVISLIIMELFISKMRKLKGVRKLIVIEEAWKAIAKNGMAEFLKYLCAPVKAA